MFVIQALWRENELKITKESIASCYREAFKELKKREVLTVGISESITQAIQNLYLFLWTPILLASSSTPINVGFIFLCMVTSIICGSKIFELTVIYLRGQLYIVLSGCLIVIFSTLFGIYFINSFEFRVVLFAVLNGLYGLYTPLYSIIKYKILEEKHRALLMNMFRIPLNAYVIVILLLLKFIDPFKVCLIAAIMGVISFLCIFSLLMYKPKVEDKTLSVFNEVKLTDVEKLLIKKMSMSSNRTNQSQEE